MDENNNLNTNNDFEPVNTDTPNTDIFVDEPTDIQPEPVAESTVEPTVEPTPEPSANPFTDPAPEPDFGGYTDPNPGYQQSVNQGAPYGSAQYQQPVSNTLGILALIFGIISLVFFCSCLNIFTGIAAIVFGIIQLAGGKGNSAGKGMAIAGIITAAISIIAFFGFWGAIMSNSNLSDISNYSSDEIEDFIENYLKENGINIDGEVNIGNNNL